MAYVTQAAIESRSTLKTISRNRALIIVQEQDPFDQWRDPMIASVRWGNILYESSFIHAKHHVTKERQISHVSSIYNKEVYNESCLTVLGISFIEWWMVV